MTTLSLVEASMLSRSILRVCSEVVDSVILDVPEDPWLHSVSLPVRVSVDEDLEQRLERHWSQRLASLSTSGMLSSTLVSPGPLLSTLRSAISVRLRQYMSEELKLTKLPSTMSPMLWLCSADVSRHPDTLKWKLVVSVSRRPGVVTGVEVSTSEGFRGWMYLGTAFSVTLRTEIRWRSKFLTDDLLLVSRFLVEVEES